MSSNEPLTRLIKAMVEAGLEALVEALDTRDVTAKETDEVTNPFHELPYIDVEKKTGRMTIDVSGLRRIYLERLGTVVTDVEPTEVAADIYRMRCRCGRLVCSVVATNCEWCRSRYEKAIAATAHNGSVEI